MASIEPAVFDSPHFNWEDPYLTILTSDCVDVDHRSPPPESVSKDGRITSLVKAGDRDWPQVQQTIKRWKEKIGKILVEDFLAVNPGTQSEYFQNKKFFKN
jgi:hypothetical protein